MSEKYRPGSAGEKEQKQFNRVILPVFSVITVICLLLSFVIPSELRDNVKAATTGWNVAGAICFGLALFMIYKAYKAGEEGARGYSMAWFVLTALGFLCAAGFYGYTY